MTDMFDTSKMPPVEVSEASYDCPMDNWRCCRRALGLSSCSRNTPAISAIRGTRCTGRTWEHHRHCFRRLSWFPTWQARTTVGDGLALRNLLETSLHRNQRQIAMSGNFPQPPHRNAVQGALALKPGKCTLKYLSLIVMQVSARKYDLSSRGLLGVPTLLGSE